MNETDIICTDIDECLEDNGSCEQLCTNMPGSHHCECYLGYGLHIDAISCVGKL